MDNLVAKEPSCRTLLPAPLIKGPTRTADIRARPQDALNKDWGLLRANVNLIHFLEVLSSGGAMKMAQPIAFAIL
jgi:hypothetical protein